MKNSWPWRGDHLTNADATGNDGEKTVAATTMIACGMRAADEGEVALCDVRYTHTWVYQIWAWA
jgi:hypothetical protein